MSQDEWPQTLMVNGSLSPAEDDSQPHRPPVTSTPTRRCKAGVCLPPPASSGFAAPSPPWPEGCNVAPTEDEGRPDNSTLPRATRKIPSCCSAPCVRRMWPRGYVARRKQPIAASALAPWSACIPGKCVRRKDARSFHNRSSSGPSTNSKSERSKVRHSHSSSHASTATPTTEPPTLVGSCRRPGAEVKEASTPGSKRATFCPKRTLSAASSRSSTPASSFALRSSDSPSRKAARPIDVLKKLSPASSSCVWGGLGAACAVKGDKRTKAEPVSKATQRWSLPPVPRSRIAPRGLLSTCAMLRKFACAAGLSSAK
mmetsp:Transcript_24515/g.70927  ORF Transcript_24515/g.70927 Transcript_24515/m.70927 type:complete len:314 (+) Transcript_24515:411-1352(+)